MDRTPDDLACAHIPVARFLGCPVCKRSPHQPVRSLCSAWCCPVYCYDCLATITECVACHAPIEASKLRLLYVPQHLAAPAYAPADGMDMPVMH